ncbi:MAG: T9SS type A sorting domain-containing protein, partial [Balneolales bacterium]|nr:T9SS type A sorting domain-containing protein [Balneolales bacterium]
VEVRDILQQTARSDDFTGTNLPNSTWGAGKVNAYAALMYSITSIDNSYFETTPVTTRLYPNYPNPFNPSTVIHYDIDTMGEVNLMVFNSIGQHVATLVSGSVQAPGSYRVAFDGSALSSGVYILRLQTSGGIRTRTMTLLK